MGPLGKGCTRLATESNQQILKSSASIWYGSSTKAISKVADHVLGPILAGQSLVIYFKGRLPGFVRQAAHHQLRSKATSLGRFRLLVLQPDLDGRSPASGPNHHHSK